jgi:integrase
MIFILLYGLGLRAGEISRLNREDIDFQRDLLVICHTKFSKADSYPLEQECRHDCLTTSGNVKIVLENLSLTVTDQTK